LYQIYPDFFSTASVNDAIDMPFSPAKAICAGIAILLAAAKGATTTYDGLVDLLESIEHFLGRLDIYTRISPTPAMNEIMVKIMELFSTFALATNELTQGRSIKFVREGFGEKEVETVLERLDRLMHDEARTLQLRLSGSSTVSSRT